MEDKRKRGAMLVIMLACALSGLENTSGKQAKSSIQAATSESVKPTPALTDSESMGLAAGFFAQSNEEITDKNWQRHPKIVAIRKIVGSVNQGLKRRTFKTSEKKLQACGDDWSTVRRIARDSKGHVTWYEHYHEGREDSSSLYNQYYDQAGRLRFALVTVYAANGTREQHRAYFDETGKLIRQSRALLKGPGYFAPTDLEELVKEDPAKEFASDQDCVEIKAKPGGSDQ